MTQLLCPARGYKRRLLPKHNFKCSYWDQRGFCGGTVALVLHLTGRTCVPKANTPVSLSKTEAALPASGSFPVHAAGATEPPTTWFRGANVGVRIRSAGLSGRRGDAGWWRISTGRDLTRASRGQWRECGWPIAGLIYHSPHLRKPPMRATRTSRVSASRSKPGPVLKAQFQLPADHGSAPPLPHTKIESAVDSLTGLPPNGQPSGTLNHVSAPTMRPRSTPIS
jgi:hypothetical protein